jgi:hypothetical protein
VFQAFTPSAQFTLKDLTATAMASAVVQTPVSDVGLMGMQALEPVQVVTPVTVPLMTPILEIPTVSPPPPTPVPEIPLPPISGFQMPQGGGYGPGFLRGRRSWYEVIPLRGPESVFEDLFADVFPSPRYRGGKAVGHRGWVSPEERPEVRREERLHAAQVKMKGGAIDADLVSPGGRKVAHLHDKVVLKKNTYVGNWNRREKKVYVDPRLKKKEREAVALHEGIEREEVVKHHLPKYPAHLVAEKLESRWDKAHGLGKDYQHHVEFLFRSNLEKQGHPIGIGGKGLDSLLGLGMPKKRSRKKK